MCTISIVAHQDGVRVVSNRDERRDRAAALDLQVAVSGARRVAMPIDPTGGGSWIGVNDTGLVAALLNRHRGPVRRTDSALASRGAIVPLALQADSLASAIAAIERLDASAFQPFSLVIVQRSEVALLISDTAKITSATAVIEGPRMFTASSLGDVLVDSPRRRLFEWLMQDCGSPLRAQSLFHRHQWSDKLEISVLMNRDDAVTVSRTTVDAGGAGIALEYEALAPTATPRRVELRPC